MSDFESLKAYPAFTPEQFGAVGDGATNDLPALQAAVNAAVAVGGRVLLSPKTYAIADELVIAGAVTIEGSGANALYGDRSIYGSDVMPTLAPYLTGSVLLQKTAGKNGIKITAVGRSVHLRGFGVRFAESIKFVNTGHGFVADPGAYSTAKNNGIVACQWSDLPVYGHDGNHYAHWLINAELMQLNNLTGWGGGGLLLECNSDVGFYGNSTFLNPYYCVMVNGTADGFRLKNTVSGGHGLIYTDFQRPQTFMIGLTNPQALAATGLASIPAPAGGQYCFYADDNAIYLNVYAADMEFDGCSSAGTRLPTLAQGSTWLGARGNGALNYDILGGNLIVAGSVNLIQRPEAAAITTLGRSATTATAADSVLTVPVASGATYTFEIEAEWFLGDSGVNNGLLFAPVTPAFSAFDYTAVIEVYQGVGYGGSGETVLKGLLVGNTLAAVGCPSYNGYARARLRLKGRITTTAAGNLALGWGQQTSNAAVFSRLPGGTIRAVKQ